MTEESSNSFECKFCNKKFTREKTVLVHMCESKRRWEQQDDVGPRLGMQAYARFYQQTMVQSGKKTYTDFVESPYYKAFVKFGWHCHEMRVISFLSFVDHLIDKKTKLDWWCQDRHYATFLKYHLRRENPQDAMVRSVGEIQRWADDEDMQLGDFFKVVSANRLVLMISNGRLSPWMIYNCTQGKEALGNLNENQIGEIYGFIDPEFWGERFSTSPDDTAWIQAVLKESGFSDPT